MKSSLFKAHFWFKLDSIVLTVRYFCHYRSIGESLALPEFNNEWLWFFKQKATICLYNFILKIQLTFSSQGFIKRKLSRLFRPRNRLLIRQDVPITGLLGIKPLVLIICPAFIFSVARIHRFPLEPATKAI